MHYCPLHYDLVFSTFQSELAVFATDPYILVPTGVARSFFASMDRARLPLPYLA